jgi:hypothetical protein
VPTADLNQQAHEFAQRVKDLLNRTVTHGIPITSVLADNGQCYVGYRVSKRDHLRVEPIPLTTSAAPARAYLIANHALRLDPEGEFLTDGRAVFGIYTDTMKKELIARWDYNRDLTEWPSAHLHVGGENEHLRGLHADFGVKPDLERHHFPVGGKRFRPCLEDVIEYAVLEGIAKPRDNWRDVIEEHRAEFHRKQLSAAVRRDQETAAEMLRHLDWSVSPPPR